ncbi:D-alanyl-D-alanine carboxypeptidase (penicillin-binding protein 5/6) [Catenulispora sp. GP43]|uniref:D-alanyl-D-alanine carboxypeptidase family protein n=1 Tax=Catenulispora sp. GP43 TaxID=3156263 RepID=UPI0035113D65
MPNPELEEQAASESPETPASEPESTASGAAAPEAESAEPPASTDEPIEPTDKRFRLRPRLRPRLRLRTLALTLGLVLVLGGAGLAAVFAAHGFDDPPAPDLKQVTPAYHDFAASLPWPNDGETALWAQGIGSLGTCGDQTPVPIASVAKVMTAYVVLKDHPLTDGESGPDILVDQQAALESFSRDESSAPVRAGQRLSERTLLELMLVPSANNVARLLARWDAGTQDAFVAEMNAAAVSLGMKDTTYTDPSGLDSSTRSTAVDQLQLAKVALTDPTLLALTAEPMTQVPDDPDVLSNTDALLGADGVVGGKTGSSTPAGGALMWAAHRTLDGEDHLVLGVVLHQASGTSPEQGLSSALLVSRRLVEAMD